MEQISLELQKMVVSFMDLKTKRSVRATSIYWFKLVDYRDFTLYFTRSSDLPSISTCLSRYEAPISLSFKKQKDLFFSGNEFAEMTTKLTNLTGLDLPRIFTREKGSLIGTDYLFLTTLSNLKSINVLDYGWNSNFDIIKVANNFRNLTSLRVQDGTRHCFFTHAMEDVTPIIEQNSSLLELEMRLSRLIVDQHFVDQFTNSRMLTKLTLAFDNVEYGACNLFTVLSNLEELAVKEVQHNVISFDEWLTPLSVLSQTLKHLSLLIRTPKHMFLTALTALESLAIDCNSTEESILQLLKSPNLRRLEMKALSPVNISGPFASLKNVRELSLTLRQAVDNATLETLLASMPHLTKLIYEPVSNGDDVKVLEKLSNLRALAYKPAVSTTKMTLRQLINLEELDVNAAVEPSDLQYSPHITFLKCNINTEPGTDYKYLASLPLKVLNIAHAAANNNLLHAIGQIAGLENLTLSALEDEHVTLLKQLTNLTKLVSHHSPNFTWTTFSQLSALLEASIQTPHHLRLERTNCRLIERLI